MNTSVEVAEIIREAVAAEREACARIADAPAKNPYITDSYQLACHEIAAKIRARGEK